MDTALKQAADLTRSYGVSPEVIEILRLLLPEVLSFDHNGPF